MNWLERRRHRKRIEQAKAVLSRSFAYARSAGDPELFPMPWASLESLLRLIGFDLGVSELAEAWADMCLDSRIAELPEQDCA